MILVVVDLCSTTRCQRVYTKRIKYKKKLQRKRCRIYLLKPIESSVAPSGAMLDIVLA